MYVTLRTVISDIENIALQGLFFTNISVTIFKLY
jgi:hypothetical protein